MKVAVVHTLVICPAVAVASHAWFHQHSAWFLLFGALCAFVIFVVAYATVEGKGTVPETLFGLAFMAGAFGVILGPNPIMAPPAMVTYLLVLLYAAAGLHCLVRVALPVR